MRNNELYHYGVIGMKWGVRRYQNKDGTLTDAGRKRYLTEDGKLNERGKKSLNKDLTKRRRDKNIHQNLERLKKNPIFRTLAKDVRKKGQEFEEEIGKQNDMMINFLRDTETRRKLANEVAEKDADTILENGKVKWKDYGYDLRRDYVDSVVEFYMDTGGPELYSPYYTKINKNARDQERRVYDAGEALRKSSEKFSKELLKEIGSDSIRKPTEKELADWGWSSMEQYMNSSIHFLKNDIADVARDYSREGYPSFRERSTKLLSASSENWAQNQKKSKHR